MKNTKINLIWSVIILATFVACGFESEQIIPVPASKPQLVVFADLPTFDQGAGDLFIVKTRNIGEKIIWDFNIGDSIRFEDSFTFINKGFPVIDTVKGVKADLLDAQGRIVHVFKNPSLPGYGTFVYEKKSILPLQKGANYTLRVSAPGFDTVYGQQPLPSEVEELKTSVKLNSFQSVENGLLSEFIVEFDDPAAEKNVYRLDLAKLRIQRNKKPIIQRLRTFKIDPLAYNENLLNDNLSNGRKIKWRVGINLDLPKDLNPSALDSLGIQYILTSTTPDFEKYVRNRDANEAAANNPFVEPVSPYTNLTGGKGFFIFSSRRTSSILLRK